MAIDAERRAVDAACLIEIGFPGQGLPVGCQRVVLVSVRAFHGAVEVPATHEEVHCPAYALRTHYIAITALSVLRYRLFVVREQARRCTVSANHADAVLPVAIRAEGHGAGAVLLHVECGTQLQEVIVLDQVLAGAAECFQTVVQVGDSRALARNLAFCGGHTRLQCSDCAGVRLLAQRAVDGAHVAVQLGDRIGLRSYLAFRTGHARSQPGDGASVRVGSGLRCVRVGNVGDHQIVDVDTIPRAARCATAGDPQAAACLLCATGTDLAGELDPLTTSATSCKRRLVDIERGRPCGLTS